MLRPYNPVQDVMVFGNLSCIDYGDAPTVPGYVVDTLDRIEAFARPIAEAGAIPIGIGGDHSATLAELRARPPVHGPLGLVHLDSHGDIWESYFGRPYNHGTLFRRALEEGLIDPGPVAAGRDARLAVRAGRPGDARGARDRDADVAGAGRASRRRVRRPGARAGRQRPGVLHVRHRLRRPVLRARRPARPEIGGPTSFQAIELVRALTGIDFRGFDVVEVAPTYDGPGQATSLIAAGVIYEMLSLIAIFRR